MSNQLFGQAKVRILVTLIDVEVMCDGDGLLNTMAYSMVSMKTMTTTPTLQGQCLYSLGGTWHFLAFPGYLQGLWRTFFGSERKNVAL